MAPKQFEDVVDLTISDSDAETDLILTPATFRRPRSLEPLEPLLADFRPDSKHMRPQGHVYCSNVDSLQMSPYRLAVHYVHE